MPGAKKLGYIEHNILLFFRSFRVKTKNLLFQITFIFDNKYPLTEYYVNIMVNIGVLCFLVRGKKKKLFKRTLCKTFGIA